MNFNSNIFKIQSWVIVDILYKLQAKCANYRNTVCHNIHWNTTHIAKKDAI